MDLRENPEAKTKRRELKPTLWIFQKELETFWEIISNDADDSLKENRGLIASRSAT